MSEMTIVEPTKAEVIETPMNEKLSFNPNDFAADMAKLQAEQDKLLGKTAIVEPVATPITPVQPEKATVTSEATKPVEVPDKFKKEDGSIDTEKLNKSTVNVDEALATYLAKEKELKRKINEVKAQENAYINPPAPTTPIPTIPINTNFAKQLEEDIAKDGAGVVLAKLFTAAQESVEERVQKEILALKNVNAENTTRTQIEAIGKNDPWVYTPEGIATLNKVLEEQPYLLQANDPYKAAYIQYKGMSNVVSRSNPQVLTTTPQARPVAPVLPGQAANQTQTQTIIKLDTKEDIDNHLRKLTPKEQSEFFKKQGFPGF